MPRPRGPPTRPITAGRASAPGRIQGRRQATTWYRPIARMEASEMSSSEPLHSVLSLVAVLLGDAADELVKMPLGPVQPNVARLRGLISEIHGLQNEMSTQPEPVACAQEDATVFETAERQLARSLLDAHRLERAGRGGEAVVMLRNVLDGELTAGHRALVARQIERLLNSMPGDENEPDLAPVEFRIAQIGTLSPSELAEIDRMLYEAASVTRRFQKVARLVGSVMAQMRDRLPAIPDIFYAQRIIRMVKLGQLEAVGDLQRMRYSEVRLARS